MNDMRSDIEIARDAQMLPIAEVANGLDIPLPALHSFGQHIAKLDLEYISGLADRPDGKLILVTAITPTRAGEGKTTTTVGLGDGLNRIGKNSIICIREPSLGPCFGMKGGAAGGGRAQVVPMENINLHFTGDFHAIGSAHNLLAAMLDNHIYWGNKLDIDERRILWRRVVDMNDRALRLIVNSLGGVGNGFPREDGFDITVASEVMAVLCLADDLEDLQRRLGRMVVAQTRDRSYITAEQLNASGAMTVLLKDALMPNLAQTLEGNPALIHGGPFANIAHGCNSAIATKTALKLADYVVTEAGFGADLGAEKFVDIKCRKAGIAPDLAVVVATVRALKMHGGVREEQIDGEDVEAVEKGLANLQRHVENITKFGIPALVAINEFVSDTEAEHKTIEAYCRDKLNVETIRCSHWAEGSRGTQGLAERVVEIIESEPTDGDRSFRYLYGDNISLWEKVQTVAREFYGASDVIADTKVRDQFKSFEQMGVGHFPVCIAKTQYSFSTDPLLKGAPKNHTVPIRELRLANGAEFIVVICGDIMTMPGLPHMPAANQIGLDENGLIQGLS